MKFHEDMDVAFKPLLDFASQFNKDDLEINKTVGQYMYMFHDDEKTYYKHFGNREYLNIHRNGTIEGKLEDWRNW